MLVTAVPLQPSLLPTLPARICKVALFIKKLIHYYYELLHFHDGVALLLCVGLACRIAFSCVSSQDEALQRGSQTCRKAGALHNKRVRWHFFSVV